MKLIIRKISVNFFIRLCFHFNEYFILGNLLMRKSKIFWNISENGIADLRFHQKCYETDIRIQMICKLYSVKDKKKRKKLQKLIKEKREREILGNILFYFSVFFFRCDQPDHMLHLQFVKN